MTGPTPYSGRVNPSTGVGGIQLVHRIGYVPGAGQEGAVIYNAPVTVQSITIQVSGMYNGTADSMGDDIGIGFYNAPHL